MKDWTYKLFSEGELSDYLIIRWERFVAAANAIRQGGGPDTLKLEDHRLRMPDLADAKFKIVEHGFKDQDVPFAQTGVLEADAPSPHPGSYIIMQISFCGGADLFRHRPPDCPGMAPQGMVCGETLRLKYERSGSGDSDWKDSLRNDLLAIETFLGRAEACVQGFNERISDMHQASTTAMFAKPHQAGSPP